MTGKRTRSEIQQWTEFYARDGAQAQEVRDKLGVKPPQARRKTVPREDREGGIQDAILAMLKLHPRVAWAVHIRTGAYEIDGRYIAYGFPGCSDILGQLRPCGRTLALEVKRPGIKPKPHQQAFLDTVRAAGGVSGCVHSVDEAAQALADAGAWQPLPPGPVSR